MKQADIDKPMPAGPQAIGPMGRGNGFGGDTSYLYAPLRAIVYKDAYKSNIAACEKCRSKGCAEASKCMPLFKRRSLKAMETGNPYSGMIVVMDEAHNMLSPEKNEEMIKAGKETIAAVKTLKTKLTTATGSAMFFLTATPIVTEPKEGEEFMNIVRGSHAKHTDKRGYVLYMNSSPKPLYPTVNPVNYINTTRIMVTPVVSEMLLELQTGGKTKKTKNKKGAKGGSLSAKQTQLNIGATSNALQIRKTYFKEPWAWDETQVRVQKFAQVAHYVKMRGLRTLVMCGLEKGLWLFREILEKVTGEEVGILTTPPTKINKSGRKVICCDSEGKKIEGESFKSKQEWDAAYERTLDRYTKNKIRYIVADSNKFSEGVSFKFTDLLLLMNPPASWAVAKQQYGRAERSCKSQKTLEIAIVVSTLKTDKAQIKAALEAGQSGGGGGGISFSMPSTGGGSNSNDVPLTADEKMLKHIIAQRNKIEPAMERDFDSIQIGREKMKRTMNLKGVIVNASMSIDIMNNDQTIKNGVRAGIKYRPTRGNIGKYMAALHRYYYKSYPQLVRKGIQEACGLSKSSGKGKKGKGKGKSKGKGGGPECAKLMKALGESTASSAVDTSHVKHMGKYAKIYEQKKKKAAGQQKSYMQPSTSSSSSSNWWSPSNWGKAFQKAT